MKKYIKSSKDQFDTRQLKNYKGYEIQKAWWVDIDGERIKKYPIFYLVAEGDEYIGDEYPSLEDAKKFIDSITRKSITSSTNSFSTTREICNAVEKVFDGYIENKEYFTGTKQYRFKINKMFGSGISILVGQVNTSNRVPGALYTSSAADNYPCVMQILNDPENFPLLNAYKRRGYTEVSNYSRSQWGTYKIVISNYDELLGVQATFERFVMNTLEEDEE